MGVDCTACTAPHPLTGISERLLTFRVPPIRAPNPRRTKEITAGQAGAGRGRAGQGRAGWCEAAQGAHTCSK